MDGREERGQSLVELAIVSPLLILIVLGLAELGHGLNSYMTVIGAGRDAARLAASRELRALPLEIEPNASFRLRLRTELAAWATGSQHLAA